MEKAFDLKDLEMKLKKVGMPEVEKLAEKAHGAVSEWMTESIEMLPEGIVKSLAQPAYKVLSEMIMQKIKDISVDEIAAGEQKAAADQSLKA